MSDREFAALVGLYDALSNWEGWQTSDIDSDAINSLIDRECEARGYRNWAHAHLALGLSSN